MKVVPIRPDRISPSRLIDGEVPRVTSEFLRTVKWPSHDARHYKLSGPGIDAGVQINNGDDDEILREVVEMAYSEEIDGPDLAHR